MADDVELMPVSPFYRLSWPDGTVFDYLDDDARLAEQIAALEPADVEGYRRFLDYSAGVYVEGYEKLGAVPFLDFRSMLRAAPQLARYQAWRSVYSVVSGFVRNEKLRQALSFHTLLVGGNPMTTSAIYALIHKLERDGGVWFARGGTHALVRGLVRHFERLGRQGPARATRSSGSRPKGGRASGVRTRSGWSGRFDAVASNADIVRTYDMLGHKRGKKAAAGLGASASRRRFSSFTSPPAGHGRTFRTTRSCSGRATRSCSVRSIAAARFRTIRRSTSITRRRPIPPWRRRASRPSTPWRRCPISAAPRLDWAKEGPVYAARILKLWRSGLCPAFRSGSRSSSITAPADFESDLNSHLGSAFSLEPRLTQSAWFRVHNRDDVIPNLYFVGAGTHPGAGIPGVVGSAKATAGLVIGDLLG
jgi:phytoene desaturase